ncbi:unnamed protein product [Closterium sp. Yama58-4]|nr:unnamed protein product [Closterium sp. Yama58-4]
MAFPRFHVLPTRDAIPPPRHSLLVEWLSVKHACLAVSLPHPLIFCHCIFQSALMALRAVGAPSNALLGDFGIAPAHSRHSRHSHLENAASFICGLPTLSAGHPIKGQAMRSRHSSRRGGMLPVRALDAAQPFDYEHQQKRRLEEKGRLKIGILGFGNFGQFLARRFARHGHHLTAWSRSDYSQVAKQMGVRFFTDMDDFCEDHPDVVLLCTSIISSDALLRSLPLQRLKRNTLFVDVLSVKVFPKMLLLQVLPPEFDILCTHPMFGPESGKGSWEGLSFVFDRVRITPGGRAEKADRFLQIFHNEGCRMVEMTCEEHDKYAAGTQFVTHTVGRVLGKLGLESTPINTKGYETLLNLVENTAGDSFDLYYGLFMYNTNATEEVEEVWFQWGDSFDLYYGLFMYNTNATEEVRFC